MSEIGVKTLGSKLADVEKQIEQESTRLQGFELAVANTERVLAGLRLDEAQLQADIRDLAPVRAAVRA